MSEAHGSVQALRGAASPHAVPQSFRAWVKARRHPLARAIYSAGMTVREAQMPVIPGVHRALYGLATSARQGLQDVLRIAWYTPLFQSRLVAPARRLRVWGGIPQVLGDLKITMGEGCGISGQTTLAGRSVGRIRPELVVGDNCEIGWRNQISVGTRVVLGNGVFMAAGCYLAGFPGHPIDPIDRAARKPDTDDQIGDIVLEDYVWLGQNVIVMAGVRIGRGTVVTAGSTVFRDLPAGVIATGNPARPVGTVPMSEPATPAPATPKE